MRLWTLCICFVYAAIGYFIYGWGAQHELHWITIAIGICAVIAHQVSVCSVATAYIMDSFPGVSAVKRKHAFTVSANRVLDFRRARVRASDLLLLHQLRYQLLRSAIH